MGMADPKDDLKKLLSGALQVKNRKEESDSEFPTEVASTRIPKKRTCENCTCSRSKDANAPKVTREELKQMSKEEVSDLANRGCQGCKLGDAFRCSDCPFTGLPAFDKGDDVFFDL